MPAPSRKFQLGERIGSGASGHVFRAQETSTGLVVAIKKSRASLRVSRTILHYETHLLRLVAGHPGIPAVFAYGHLEHFEYLAMELLGDSLGDLVSRKGCLPLESVLQAADQMISVLKHIHGRRILHRDIKPNNILLRQNGDIFSLCLIDFGIARPFLKGEPSTHDPIEECRNIVGTLPWASLNSHDGVDLSPRDDLESLAYTLLFLLRGDLPWQRFCRCGTLLSRMAHVREKKRGWSGSRLCEGHPHVFGWLLDYSRGLKFHDSIDYDHLQSQFQVAKEARGLTAFREHSNKILHTEIKLKEIPFNVWMPTSVKIEPRPSTKGYNMHASDWPKLDPSVRTSLVESSRNGIAHTAQSDHSDTISRNGSGLKAPSPPTEIGGLIFIQIVPQLSIEGYSMQAVDPSYWHDPSLRLELWHMHPRPAIVIRTDYDKSLCMHKVEVISLGRGKPKEETPHIPLSTASSSSAVHPEKDTIMSQPAWPMSDTYCYAFPHATMFYCLPGQAQMPVHWKISLDDVQRLKEKFDVPPALHWQTALKDPNPDVRHEARMTSWEKVRFFAKCDVLKPSDVESSSTGDIEWQGDRAWFDEQVKISRRRGRDQGRGWTGDVQDESEGSRLSNSYYESDFELWDFPQQGREPSATLDVEQQEFFREVTGEQELSVISEVI